MAMEGAIASDFFETTASQLPAPPHPLSHPPALLPRCRLLPPPSTIHADTRTCHARPAYVSAQKEELSAERKADQTAVDGTVKCDAKMKLYLKDRFSLSKRDAPHKMIF